jgi:hypothetical protein
VPVPVHAGYRHVFAPTGTSKYAHPGPRCAPNARQ